ncbi:MAG: pilus assembly protein PilP [Saezia sp.]
MHKLKSILSISMVALMMTACSASDDVSQWLAQQKAANQPVPSELDGIKLDDIALKPESYQGVGLLSPMNQTKLYNTLTTNTEFPLCIQQQIDRKQNRPEPLESYPLDALKAVGYIKESAGRKAMALIQIGDHQIFEAYIGQYVGFDYGRVTGISETEIYITETMYLPGSDACEERDITLNIQGG